MKEKNKLNSNQIIVKKANKNQTKAKLKPNKKQIKTKLKSNRNQIKLN